MWGHRIYGRHLKGAATVDVVEQVSGQNIHMRLPDVEDTV